MGSEINSLSWGSEVGKVSFFENCALEIGAWEDNPFSLLCHLVRTD